MQPAPALRRRSRSRSAALMGLEERNTLNQLGLVVGGANARGWKKKEKDIVRLNIYF